MTACIVDVLIPVFNGADYVKSSVESIINQSLTNIAIHVVDDGSTDCTSQILSELAGSDRRVHIHRKENGGIVDALNYGLEFCRAEFIARHDADDLASTGRLQSQVTFLRDHPEVIATASSARHVNPDGKFMGTFARFGATENADPRYIPAKEPYLLHPFLMVRREALQRVGGYRYVIHAEDADLYWRLQELGKLFNDPAVQGDYRMHDNSISSKSVRNGRVMAVSSQLCALSAVRRSEKRPDISFSPEGGAKLRASSQSMETACESVSADLSSDERRHLRLAAGAKLLEMADYRPYEVELSDCIFLDQVYGDFITSVAGENRDILRRAFSGTAARLASRGRWTQAFKLLQPGMGLPFLVRLLFRLMLPSPLHRRIRHITGPILRLTRGV